MSFDDYWKRRMEKHTACTTAEVEDHMRTWQAAQADALSPGKKWKSIGGRIRRLRVRPGDLLVLDVGSVRDEELAFLTKHIRNVLEAMLGPKKANRIGAIVTNFKVSVRVVPVDGVKTIEVCVKDADFSDALAEEIRDTVSMEIQKIHRIGRYEMAKGDKCKK